VALDVGRVFEKVQNQNQKKKLGKFTENIWGTIKPIYW